MHPKLTTVSTRDTSVDFQPIRGGSMLEQFSSVGILEKQQYQREIFKQEAFCRSQMEQTNLSNSYNLFVYPTTLHKELTSARCSISCEFFIALTGKTTIMVYACAICTAIVSIK